MSVTKEDVKQCILFEKKVFDAAENLLDEYRKLWFEQLQIVPYTVNEKYDAHNKALQNKQIAQDKDLLAKLKAQYPEAQ